MVRSPKSERKLHYKKSRRRARGVATAYARISRQHGRLGRRHKHFVLYEFCRRWPAEFAAYSIACKCERDAKSANQILARQFLVVIHFWRLIFAL